MGVVSAASILSHLLAKNIIPSKVPTDPRSLTSAILSLLRKDDLKRAVSLLFQSTVPVPFSLYSRLFRVCSARQAILEARKVECHLITFNPTPPTFLLNRAIEAFGYCGCLADAQELFNEMPKRDGGSWNALITANAQWDRVDKVFRLFLRMCRSGFAATEVSYAGVLRCCGMVREACLARQVHGVLLKCGFGENVILQSSLVDIFGKCGLIEDSRRVFDEMKRPNEVSWNVIVRRYLEVGNAREAISVFFEMVRKGICPLNFTVSNVLIACSRVLAAKEGMQIHGYSVKVCLDSDEVVCSSLICLYLKCDELEDAQMVFDQPGAKSIVSWTSMVSGYAFTGRIGKARELFDEMPERNIISWNAMLARYIDCKEWDEAVNFLHMMCSMNENVDHVTLSLVAKVAAGLGDIDMGKQLHGFVHRHGYSSNLLVANSLLDMYGKCRNFKVSRILFDQMNQSRDSVSWNSFLASYARHGMSEHAMEIFGEMHWETMLSEFTCGILLAACANTSSLNYGKQIHAFMLRNEYDIDVVVRGALVDMYSKCRYIDYGLKVFKEAALRDIVLWNSIILGCCYNGKAREALKMYKLMFKDGAKPDNVTMQGLLLACVLEGHLDLGRRLFKSMSKVYNIIPRLEHYELMVRLYTCHGRIDELETFIKTMPFDPTVEMLRRILKACRKRGLLRMEKWASNLLTGLSTVSHAKMKLRNRSWISKVVKDNLA